MANKVAISFPIFIGINSKQEFRSDFVAPGFPRIKYGADFVVFFIGTMLSEMAPEFPSLPLYERE